MKIGLCQINPTIGAFSSNLRKMIDFASEAREKGAELVVFPELSLVGYPPRDLLEEPEFIKAQAKLVEEMVKASTGMAIIFGFVDEAKKQQGKGLFNAAAICVEGKLRGVYHKRLLPYYDVFEEERYFEKGEGPSTFDVGKYRVGITICEDAWNLGGGLPRSYSEQPLDAFPKGKLDVLVNLSASPFSLGKHEFRKELFGRVAQYVGAPVVMCNQVGGNDELIFDGGSFVLNAKAELLAQAKAFEEQLIIVDTESTSKAPAIELKEEQALYRALVCGLKDFVSKCGVSRVGIGLSGGIDSAVAAALAVAALGPEAVFVAALPTRFNANSSEEDARAVASALGLSLEVMPIDEPFQWFEKNFKKWIGKSPRGLTLENIQPRLRMTVLMALCNERDAILVNTSNKSEIATGFSTLYGDHAGGISPLGDLTKTQIYALGRYINSIRPIIPDRVFVRPPTAELAENQKDEDRLPPYAVLDPLVVEAVERHRIPPSADARYGRLYASAEHKRRQFPPILRVSSKAFGMGRRIPIASQKPWT